MEMTITQKPGAVVLLHLKGVLDGTSYRDLIKEAQKLYDGGARDLVLDLGGLTFMSSAGISGLHRVALIFRGEKQADMEEGWGAYRAIGRERESGGYQRHVKLLNPPERVQHALELVGFASFFEVHTDAEVAVASFH
jgi:anti-anti-sigma regulatory factor